MQTTIIVTSTVHMTLKDAAFTPAFIEEFASTMAPLMDIKDHAEYLSGLLVSGVLEDVGKGFGENQVIEGYGRICDFVEVARVGSVESETET